MATHSNIPTWKIPWTWELGELQSMESQTARHDWAANVFTHFPALAGRFFTTEPPGKCWVRIFKQLRTILQTCIHASFGKKGKCVSGLKTWAWHWFPSLRWSQCICDLSDLWSQWSEKVHVDGEETAKKRILGMFEFRPREKSLTVRKEASRGGAGGWDMEGGLVTDLQSLDSVTALILVPPLVIWKSFLLSGLKSCSFEVNR